MTPHRLKILLTELENYSKRRVEDAKNPDAILEDAKNDGLSIAYEYAYMAGYLGKAQEIGLQQLQKIISELESDNWEVAEDE